MQFICEHPFKKTSFSRFRILPRPIKMKKPPSDVFLTIENTHHDTFLYALTRKCNVITRKKNKEKERERLLHAKFSQKISSSCNCTEQLRKKRRNLAQGQFPRYELAVVTKQIRLFFLAYMEIGNTSTHARNLFSPSVISSNNVLLL